MAELLSVPSSIAWISNYIHYEMWDEITYAFPNFNVATVEVWEWMSNSLCVWYSFPLLDHSKRFINRLVVISYIIFVFRWKTVLHIFYHLQWYWITDQVTTYPNVRVVLYHIMLFIVTIIIYTVEFVYFVSCVLYNWAMFDYNTWLAMFMLLLYTSTRPLLPSKTCIGKKRPSNSKPTYPMI